MPWGLMIRDRFRPLDVAKRLHRIDTFTGRSYNISVLVNQQICC